AAYSSYGGSCHQTSRADGRQSTAYRAHRGGDAAHGAPEACAQVTLEAAFDARYGIGCFVAGLPEGGLEAGDVSVYLSCNPTCIGWHC
ncbi:MAG TPA: hypothetical protein PK602_05715, partial [Methanothrix sp.]|nr:hypothetical protein [Methanothrix sp.]